MRTLALLFALFLAAPAWAGVSSPAGGGGGAQNCPNPGDVWKNVGGVNQCAPDATGGSPGFNNITSGSNTTATMTVGAGSTLGPTSTGAITANRVDGVDAAAGTNRGTNPGQIRMAAHNTNCKSLTDGVAMEICVEKDSDVKYTCRPTAGGCDTAAEWVAENGSMSRYVVQTTDFAGTIFAPASIDGTANQAFTYALVTTWKGTTFTDGAIWMWGTYNPADADLNTGYNGFQPLYAHYDPVATNNGSNFSAFAEQVRVFGESYFQGLVMEIRPGSQLYVTDGNNPWVLKRGVLNACSGLQLFLNNAEEDGITPGTGNCTLTGDPNPNSNAATILTCSTAAFCGGDSPSDSTGCFDNVATENKTWPGYSIAIDNSIAMDAGNKRVFRVRRVLSDTQVEIWPPQTTAVASTTFSYANNAGFIFDETPPSAIAGQLDPLADPAVLCPERFTVLLTGNGRTVNPYDDGGAGGNMRGADAASCASYVAACSGADAPYDGCTSGGAGTCTQGYRRTPMVGAINRNSNATINFNIVGTGGTWDTCAAFTGMQNMQFTSHHGAFMGTCNNFGGPDSEEFVYGMTGRDKTITTDDGLNCTLFLAVPNVNPVQPRGSDVNVNMICLAGPNGGNYTIDLAKAQSTETRIYAPRGTQNLRVINSSREEILHCGSGTTETCPATLQPLYRIGPWDPDGPDASAGDTNFSAYYGLDGAGKTFFLEGYKRRVFDINCGGHPCLVEVGGGYEYVDDLFSLSATSGMAFVRGAVMCRMALTGPTGNCLPGVGTGFNTDDLTVQDQTGAILFAGDKVRMSVPGQFASMTELTTPDGDELLMVEEPDVAGSPKRRITRSNFMGALGAGDLLKSGTYQTDGILCGASGDTTQVRRCAVNATINSAGQLSLPDQTVAPGNHMSVLENGTDITPNPTCANSGLADGWSWVDIDEANGTRTFVGCLNQVEMFRLPSTAVTPSRVAQFDANGMLTSGAGVAVVLIASGAEPLATSSIASAACSTADTALTATGVVSTDAISWSFNADVTGLTGWAPATTGGLSIYAYPSTNAVNFKVCNPTANPITPQAVTLNWRVVR